MPKQTIQIGATDNDNTGDPLRTAFLKTNENFTELYSAVVQTSGTVAAEEIDWSAGNYFFKKLSANTAFTFANADDAMSVTVAVENTTGNYTVTWPTVKWPEGTAPTQTTGAIVDVYSFVNMNGTIYGSAVQNLS